MKHLKGFKTLNRTHAHRKALYRNMVEALLKHERITTTVVKAKELRRVAEKLITKAKTNDLHTIRLINRLIRDKNILMKLFNEIAPRYTERKGGYTRIIKLAKRKGDGADLCFIELVEELAPKAPAKKKKTAAKKAAPKKEAAVEAPATAEAEQASEQKNDEPAAE